MSNHTEKHEQMTVGVDVSAGCTAFGPNGLTLRDWFAGQALNGVLLAGGEPGQTAEK